MYEGYYRSPQCTIPKLPAYGGPEAIVEKHSPQKTPSYDPYNSYSSPPVAQMTKFNFGYENSVSPTPQPRLDLQKRGMRPYSATNRVKDLKSVKDVFKSPKLGRMKVSHTTSNKVIDCTNSSDYEAEGTIVLIPRAHMYSTQMEGNELSKKDKRLFNDRPAEKKVGFNSRLPVISQSTKLTIPKKSNKSHRREYASRQKTPNLPEVPKDVERANRLEGKIRGAGPTDPNGFRSTLTPNRPDLDVQSAITAYVMATNNLAQKYSANRQSYSQISTKSNHSTHQNLKRFSSTHEAGESDFVSPPAKKKLRRPQNISAQHA